MANPTPLASQTKNHVSKHGFLLFLKNNGIIMSHGQAQCG